MTRHWSTSFLLSNLCRLHPLLHCILKLKCHSSPLFNEVVDLNGNHSCFTASNSQEDLLKHAEFPLFPDLDKSKKQYIVPIAPKQEIAPKICIPMAEITKIPMPQQSSELTLVDEDRELLNQDQASFFIMCEKMKRPIDDSFKKNKKQRPSKPGIFDKKPNAIPRPPNSFILYRRHKHAEIINSYRGDKALNNNFISKIVARWWKQEPQEVKKYWADLADEEKKAHAEKYPNYKYQPKKAASKCSAGFAYNTPALLPLDGSRLGYQMGIAPHYMHSVHNDQLFSQWPGFAAVAHHDAFDQQHIKLKDNAYLTSAQFAAKPEITNDKDTLWTEHL